MKEEREERWKGSNGGREGVRGEKIEREDGGRV